jgi:hypothetical protein
VGVLYAVRGDGTRLGVSRISVVAADSCGLWFEIAIRDEATLWTWMFCMHRRPPLTTPQLQVVIKRRNDEEPELIDFRRDPRQRAAYQWLLDQITPRWVGRTALPREDVRVYAGTFDQIRLAGLIRWFRSTVG